jgi:hypothetical protein
MSEQVIDTDPAQIIRMVFEHMEAWARGNGGKFYLADDIENAMTLLADRPGSWCGVMHWAGDAPQGDLRRSWVVENKIKVFIKAVTAPTAVRNAELFRETASRSTPVLETIDAVRTEMQRIVIPGLDDYNKSVAYRGTTDQASVGGYAVAVYVMDFVVSTAIAVPAEGDLVELEP